MKQTDLKTRVITFRVPELMWQQAFQRAVLSGKAVGEWARDEIAGCLSEAHGMTPGERLTMVEINNLRELIETLVLTEAGNAQGEQRQILVESLEKSIDNREAAARDYFAQLAEVGAAGGHGEVRDAR